ncbi:rRNA-processing protein utp21 [Marasmius crinis-equi]|uniref:rRNA-processing protein utp21 n=1 Tax=Marasmius crinis-equi TaxID=585013 RepID=A0ABR3FT83_9AGAR
MSITTTEDPTLHPPRKKVRQSQSTKKSSSRLPNESRLFVPFRALGLVTNHVPFVLQTRSHKGATDGPRIHILTCLGKSWALWNGAKMDLLFVGPEVSEQISCLTMDGDAVWAATGCHVVKYLRGKETLRVSNPTETTLSFITIFGSRLLALTENGDRLLCWDTSDGSFQNTIQFDIGFTATSILHPATYLNKILVSSSEGDLQLWNIQSQYALRSPFVPYQPYPNVHLPRSCIHKFPASRLVSSTSTSAITAMTQSPAIDVVGIGFTSGEISLYDVRADERLMRLFMTGGGIRSLSFRSDGEPILASASSLGHIAIWDLNAGGRLLHMVHGAHDSAISALDWVPGQPILISSGEDNSVKQWLFDSPTSAPRLLKFRSGHSAPPHLVSYYGEDGKQLLTASRDRSLRCTSVVRDSRSFELSQGSLTKKASSLSVPVGSLKFPPIIAISHSSARSKDWDDILTAHTDETFARSWTMQSKKLGKYSLSFAEAAKSKGEGRVPPLGSVKAVCVTACGNFGLASSSTGAIHMWNMQSGIRRRTFDVGACPAKAATTTRTTERSVTGLACDALNRVVIASTLDGTVNFFDFHTAKLEHTVVLSSAAVSILLHRDSGLLAVVCDDMVVRLLDIETRRIVRELGGLKGRVLDITFSADSRWLITTSLDSIIRTFDIPTGRLVDAFKTSSVASSVCFSPTGDFLATAHVDSVGVYLWANRAQYMEVSLQGISEEDVTSAQLPSMQGVGEDEEDLDALVPLTLDNKTPSDVFSTPPRLDGDLITLTLLPRSRWQTLLNIEIIQQRNKPKEAPKAPEQAPFFLPTLPGVDQRFAIQQKGSDEKNQKSKPTRRLEQAAANTKSVFLEKLVGDKEDGDYESFFSYTKTLSPSALDLEIRSLGSLKHMRVFINAMIQRLSSHQDFEAVQAMQSVFLRVHADEVIANEEVHPDLTRLREVQRAESRRVLELVASSLGALGFVRDTM